MNSNATAAWLLVSAMCFAGAASAGITKYDDSFSGDYTITHKSDFDTDADEDALTLSTLLASKIIKADGSVNYLLVVSTNAARVPDDGKWIQRVPEDRAVWMIDGQATRLGSAIVNSEVQGKFVRRYFYVHLGEQEFRKLADASSAEIVVGEQKFVISPDSLAEIREVAETGRP